MRWREGPPAALCLALLAAGLGDIIRYDGDVNIGVLVDLHARSQTGGCGRLKMESVQLVLAAKWAVDVINNQSLPHELSIGLQIHDSCSNPELGQRQLLDIIRTVQTKVSGQPKLIGLIGMGNPDSLISASTTLSAYHVPVVNVRPDFHSDLGDFSNVLTTAPDLRAQASSLVHLASSLGARKVALITSSSQTVATILTEATSLGLRVQEMLELQPGQHNMGLAVETFIRSLNRPRPVVAVVLRAEEVEEVAEHLNTISLPSSPLWLVGSLGLELRNLQSWKKVFSGGAFVEPHLPELREFKHYFFKSLKSAESLLSSTVEEYMAELTGCTTPGGSQHSQGKGVSCSNISEEEMELRFQQDPQVSFVVKAVSALTAAFRLVQLSSCNQQRLDVGCLRSLRPELHDEILDNLHKLSFTSMSEMGGTKHHFTQGGRLVASKQIVYSILRDSREIQPIGWYSQDQGLHIKENLILGVNSSDPVLASSLVTDKDRSVHSRSIGSPGLTTATTTTIRPGSSRDMSIIATYESFIGRTWALVVISLAIFGICVSLWMLSYVFIKMCDGTLNGNQSMGVLLLFGVMITFASVVPWLLPPSQIICAVRHFLHPLAFCLCFGLLLLKVMQLRSLVSVGLGGTIPQINQFLSLFFMVMVQVVITTEWYVINMPLTVTFNSPGLYPECEVARETFLLLHVYPTLLLVLTFLYGMSVFRIKRNYNEGRWVTCAAVCIIPVLTAWAIVYYFAPANLHDPTNAICIVIIGGVLISTIFFPKMHTISQQSKYRKLKMSSGSDSTVYTTYTNDYPSYYTNCTGGYPPPGYHHKNMARYSRSHSKYRHPSHIQRVNGNPYLSRFNGLNYLSHHPYLGPASMSYTDWSRDQTPGYYYYPTHLHDPHCERAGLLHSSSSSSSPNNNHHHHHRHHHGHRKSASKEGTLGHVGPTKPSSRGREQGEVMYRGSPSKKSSLKNSSPQLGLLLNPNGLPSNHNQSHYDESSRVYHITP